MAGVLKQVYSNQNLGLVGAMRSYLEKNQVACELHNEFLSGVSGGVAVFDVWPELWVNEDQYAKAVALLAEMQQQEAAGPEWTCGRCAESNPPNFEVCWQCGQPKRPVRQVPGNQ